MSTQTTVTQRAHQDVHANTTWIRRHPANTPIIFRCCNKTPSPARSEATHAFLISMYLSLCACQCTRTARQHRTCSSHRWPPAPPRWMKRDTHPGETSTPTAAARAGHPAAHTPVSSMPHTAAWRTHYRRTGSGKACVYLEKGNLSHDVLALNAAGLVKEGGPGRRGQRIGGRAAHARCPQAMECTLGIVPTLLGRRPKTSLRPGSVHFLAAPAARRRPHVGITKDAVTPPDLLRRAASLV